MKKTNLLSPSYLSLIVLMVVACISCAHQKTGDSAALDSVDGADHHIWADAKDIAETVEGEEVVQEKQAASDMADISVASNPAPSTDGVIVGITEQTTAPTDGVKAKTEEGEADEDGLDEMMKTAENAEAGDKPLAPITVARIDNPKEDPKVVTGEMVAHSPNDTFQANKEVYETERREPASESSSEAKLEASTESQSSNVPSIAVPAEIKDTAIPTNRKPTGKRSSTQDSAPKKVDAAVPTTVTPKATQDTQAKVGKPSAPVAVIAKEMEESFGHEPIPGKQQVATDEREESDAQLASVQIATFIENHVIAVIIGIVGFITGLYLFMRKNKENDNNSL